MKVKKAWRGLHANRYQREALERAYALAWQLHCTEKISVSGNRPDMLDYLLATDQSHPVVARASDRDREVAATVIQWLGSPVGQGFVQGVLESCGTATRDRA